mgnify:CR=1 FL=1
MKLSIRQFSLISLLAGALLGYALTGEEQSLADPASDWLNSYNTVAEGTMPGMPEMAWAASVSLPWAPAPRPR